MNHSKLILLNGPLNCGKTYAVEHLKALGYPLVERRCKDKLFTLTQELFSVAPERFWETYNIRELKELPLEDYLLQTDKYLELSDYLGTNRPFTEFEGHVRISVREAMIYVSEFLCKPSFGEEYFGEARVRDMQEDEVAVDDSAAFVGELQPAIRELGQDNLLLIRILGRGSFDGDSRNYIPDGIVNNTVDVYNTGSLGEFLSEMNFHVNKFLEG